MAIGIVIGSMIFAGVFAIVWGTKAYRENYERTQHKFPDAEVFKLMSRANHFLTAQQLAAVSPLDLSEASSRLTYLSMYGAIKGYADGSGMQSVYQLKEELPEDDVLPISIEGLTDQQIIDAVLSYSDDYQITIAELSVVFGLNINQATDVLKRLKKSGLVKPYWQGFERIFVISSSLGTTTPQFNNRKDLTTMGKIAIPTNRERIKIPDADILGLAIQHEGRLTPALVCLKLEIPLTDAKAKLEDLHSQGALWLDVDERNAVIEYHLSDTSLLSEKDKNK